MWHFTWHAERVNVFMILMPKYSRCRGLEAHSIIG